MTGQKECHVAFRTQKTSIALALLGLGVAHHGAAQASNTAFTVQGDLRSGAAAADGTYDFDARLHLAGGSTPIDSQVLEDVPVSGGHFTLVLDFTEAPFLQTDVGLEIELAIRAGSSTGAFTALDRRILLEAAPVAVVARAVVPGAVGAEGIVPGEVQRRVSGACLAGQAIRSIDESGAVQCDVDERGAAIVAGTGLVGGGSSGVVDLSVDFAAVQRRVVNGCPIGQSIRSIGADGGVSCEFDDVAGTIAQESASVSFSGLGGGTIQTQATAQCPGGWRAIGGGFETNCAGALVYTSRPTPSNQGWFVQLVKGTPVACQNPATLTAFVSCVPL